MSDELLQLRKELAFQLEGGSAHASFEEVTRSFPAKMRGVVPAGMPYSAWQLLEHIRIAQRDMLDFCMNEDGSYKAMQWPKDYWPESAAPPIAKAWDASIAQCNADRARFAELISDPKAPLFDPFPWGDGQTLFHEACLVLDHNAYHLGELVAVRRALKIWPPQA